MSSSGYGSKMRAQNGILVTGTKDGLTCSPYPGGLILTHTQLATQGKFMKSPGKVYLMKSSTNSGSEFIQKPSPKNGRNSENEFVLATRIFRPRLSLERGKTHPPPRCPGPPGSPPRRHGSTLPGRGAGPLRPPDGRSLIPTKRLGGYGCGSEIGQSQNGLPW